VTEARTMHPEQESLILETRRQFFGRAATGIGAVALASLMKGAPAQAAEVASAPPFGGLPSLPHFAPRAKRAIYLHMVGAPPQQDLFDYKPKMAEMYDKDLPES